MHGMPLSFLARLFDTSIVPGCQWISKLPPFDLSTQLVYVGLRDVDKGERDIIHQFGIKAFTMSDVDRYGIGKVSCAVQYLYYPPLCNPHWLAGDGDGNGPPQRPPSAYEL